MAEFEVKFKRYQSVGNTWVNASRTYVADNAKAALKKFTESFAKDVVPPRMTKVTRTVMIGEIETTVKAIYVK